MHRILIPTESAEDWTRLLADPEKQRRKGYSARSLAYCWEDAKGFPSEIARLFSHSGVESFRHVELLLALPEHQVPLPGGARPSQNDVFALGKDVDGNLISITIEGKVSESFGPTLEEWKAEESPGRRKRLEYIQELLGLPEEPANDIRYQLLHRTASAVIEARRFNAKTAVMVVHSFSQEDQWFEEFGAFIALFGKEGVPNRLIFLRETSGIAIYSGWVRGDAKYLEM
jgi:hypothetical protein